MALGHRAPLVFGRAEALAPSLIQAPPDYCVYFDCCG